MMTESKENTKPAWFQFHVTVDSKLVEPLTTLFESLSAAAVTTENAGRDEFYEVAFPGTPSWDSVRVTGLFDGQSDIDKIKNLTLGALQENGVIKVPYTLERLEDQNWERVWLDSFKPIQVGDRLWVVPSWCEPVDESARNITLDPGLAFGTGTHATTFMCLDWISRQNLTGHKVLDYGSGSGILAIAALMSNASFADAVDIDPMAVDACRENAKRNEFNSISLNEKMAAFLPQDLPKSNAPYQLVIANILAEVILQLRELLTEAVAESGQLLLTGILNTQKDKVVSAFSNEFDFEVQEQDHWVLLIGQKR